MALRAVRPDTGNQMQGDVLGAGAFGQSTFHRHAHGLGPFLPDGLRHHHMGDFGCADAEGIGPEGAVGGGVAVAAHHDITWQRQALRRNGHMHNALSGIIQSEQGDIVPGAIVGELVDHPLDLGRQRIAVAGRHIVIGDAEGQIGTVQPRLPFGELVERMERAFMQQMPVDPQQRLAVLAVDNHMRIPDFVDQGFGA